MNRYDRIITHWNQIFSKEKAVAVESTKTGQKDLDNALDWLCKGTDSILDFGCGNGNMLFRSYLRGVFHCVGIDISKEAVELASRIQEESKLVGFQFVHGDVNQLRNFGNETFSAVILSNVLDNLLPMDGLKLLEETNRVLKKNGKVLVKLNPFLETSEFLRYNIKIIEGNLLDDGLFLWNQTNEEWTHLFGKYFTIVEYKEIYYEQYEQSNRLFLLQKKG